MLLKVMPAATSGCLLEDRACYCFKAMIAIPRDYSFSSGKALPPLAPNPALFLDVDGTLLDLAENPDGVSVPARLIEALSRLSRANDGAVALISGRTIRDLDRLFAPLQLPAAGQHGLERRDYDGAMHYHHELDTRLDGIRDRLQGFIDANPGVLLEDKGFSMAVHYRGAPEKEDQVDTFIRRLMPGIEKEFHVLRGKMVFEIKPGGRNKGMAIGEFMQEEPFRHRTPVFIGDDVTDEDGFAVVNNLGGYSIKVGEGKTAAGWRLGQPSRVMEYLSGYTTGLTKQEQNQQ